jgi:tetratricopeptide (TPR) repeat protein
MNAIADKRMSQDAMLAQIEQVLRSGGTKDPPAYTLILGAGGSSGVVPTAREMLGLPDKAGCIHNGCIPFWIKRCREPLDPIPSSLDEQRKLVRHFWEKFLKWNPDLKPSKTTANNVSAIDLCDGLAGSNLVIADAYQALFDQKRTGGLNTPQLARRFLREITLPENGKTRLNATHFYLASLLSLQRRPDQKGMKGELFYVGRRPFVRTLFTSNFDPLLQTSLQLFQLLYYMTDRPEMLSADALQTDDYPAIHLFYAHGSVHRPFLANTDREIRLLKDRNSRALAAYLGTHGVIVLGYSGWDDCLLHALNQTSSFANNLYWLARSEDSLSESVQKFLLGCANAYWVSIEDGGQFVAALHARLCPGARNTELLHNPVRPLLEQLKAVSLSDIPVGTSILSASRSGTDKRRSELISDVPDNAEELRKKIVTILKGVEQQFLSTAPSAGRSMDELLQQADLKFSNEDWDAALAAYNRIIEDPIFSALPVEQMGKAYLRRAECYRAKGDSDSATNDYTKVIELPNARPDQVATALRKRGNRHARKGDLDKAIADYTEAIDLPGATTEQVAAALVNRGNCYQDKGDDDKAIDDYTKAIAWPHAPADQVSRALVNRGDRYRKKGDDDKAIADYTKAIAWPHAPADQVNRALVNRGNCHGRRGDQDKAIADYTKLVDSDDATADQKAEALVKRGSCFALKGDHYKAIADCEWVINKLPYVRPDQMARALLCRGDVYRQNGNSEKAKIDYNQVLKRPDTPPELAKKASRRIAALE